MSVFFPSLVTTAPLTHSLLIPFAAQRSGFARRECNEWRKKTDERSEMRTVGTNEGTK